jgi:deoxycytidylate deaminase
MTEKLKNKLLAITRELKSVPNGRNKHFSFILHRNRILSVGWNDYWTSHPESKRLGCRFDAIHSELSAVLRYRGPANKLRKCILVNTRVNVFDEIGMSRPCEFCQKLINEVSFRQVWFTDLTGNFQRYK